MRQLSRMVLELARKLFELAPMVLENSRMVRQITRISTTYFIQVVLKQILKNFATTD
jgi:hypothetical protein